ncbi:MAG: hypothetical protein MJ249_03090 [Kiritimatiellae bacterium]|nr:hypothetical protein [Kiritimatiellia bacterium]
MTFCGSKYCGLLLAATFSTLIEFLMSLSDEVVVGNILGETALGAMNLLQSPINLISFFSALLGVGAAICFSVEMGRFQRRRAVEMFSVGIWSALAFGVFLWGAMLAVRGPFLALLGATAETCSLATSYWVWWSPCALLELLAVVLANACYADGDSRLCVVSYVVQFVGNCVFSVPLTFVLGMSGCGLGTTLGNLLAILVLLLHFRRKANTLRVVRHFSFRDLGAIVKTSFGDAGSRLCNAALFLLLTHYVVAHFGSKMLPVLGAALTVLGISEAFNGPANAAQPLVSVYYGEGNLRGIRQVMTMALKTMLAASVALGALLVLCPILLTRLLGITDPPLVASAATAVRFTAAGMVGLGLVALFNSYFAFIDRGLLSAMLTVLSGLLVPVSLCLPMGTLWGISGVWLALGMAPVLSCVLVAVWLWMREGRGRMPWLLDRSRESSIAMFDLKLEDQAICRVSSEIGSLLRANGATDSAVRAELLIEEVFMAVKERNVGRSVLAEATLMLDEEPSLVLRDDGEVFDITDADAKISSLRSYLVASLMNVQKNRMNLTTTGYNRNVFKFNRRVESAEG